MSGFLRKELTLEQLKQAFHQVPPALAQNIPILNIIIIIVCDIINIMQVLNQVPPTLTQYI